MNPRISTNMMYQQSLSNMLTKQVRIDHISRQLASQQRFVTAKDDPIAAGITQRLDRSLAALEQYGKNANGVKSRLGMQENALAGANEVMMRVKDLTIEANNGARSLAERQMIAREISVLKDSLLDLANSTDGRERYLFAGTADAQAPFATSGGKVVYHGDQIQRQVEIAPDTLVKDVLPGSDVFFRIGPDNQDAFAILDHLVDALNQPASSPDEQAALNDALKTGLRDLSLASERFIDARATIGVQLTQVDAAAELCAANALTLKTDLSAIRDLDPAQALSDYNLEKIALQVTQSIFMQMQSMSLFNYMH